MIKLISCLCNSQQKLKSSGKVKIHLSLAPFLKAKTSFKKKLTLNKFSI